VLAVTRRGEVWVANLNPYRGRETGKVQPVVVIQCDDLGAAVMPLVVCLPLTSQVHSGFSHWWVTLAACDRLLNPCQGVTDQPRTLDRARFGEGHLTTLTTDELAVVELSLKAVLGMW
jgi:mRNA interferase MazF